MEYIAHRINTIEQLKSLSTEFGAEIDLRDYGDELILQHEPFQSGENLEDFLQHYSHGTLILNIKSERIEFKVLDLLKKYNVTSYFFLDSSFPMIYLLSNMQENNIALRYSEFEGIETLLKMKTLAKWVWVDCFSKLPINKDDFNLLKKCGYKICLVSPELQGQAEKLPEYKNYLDRNGIILDAVCTKMNSIINWAR